MFGIKPGDAVIVCDACRCYHPIMWKVADVDFAKAHIMHNPAAGVRLAVKGATPPGYVMK
jgi:hypothetical protein